MIEPVPDFVDSKYFESETDWHLKDGADGQTKKEFEEYQNSEKLSALYKKGMTIIVELELDSPYDLTQEEIEKDLRLGEIQIGWNYDYKIKSVEVT